MNPFPYSHDNKRYYTWNHYLKSTYDSKVFKVPLDAGFSCPHRNSEGIGGCTFCSIAGSGDYAGNRRDTLKKQYDEGFAMMARKWPSAKGIAYFQAYTNTYAPLSKLKEVYDPFFDDHPCLAVSIATRADCLDENIIAYLKEKSKIKPLYLEIGVQTIFDFTAKRVNRRENIVDIEKKLDMLKSAGIDVVIHIINGLPGETADMMLETARWVAKKSPFAIKIHMLHIIKDTVLAQQFEHHPFPILSKEEYVDIVVRQLEVLPPTTVIQRLTGDAVKEDLIEPTWTLKKVSVLNDIDKAMVRSDTWQGKKYES
jgi:uncharacterized protein